MQADYQPFIDRVIQKYEGPYGWNRKDPGGPTKYGITCYDLAEHRGQKMTSMAAWEQPVRDMQLAEAEAIYKTKYAAAIKFDELPAGIDCCMLDYGINSGTSRVLRVAKAIGVKNPKDLIDAMCDERLRFMHAIRGGSAWAEFGHGWGARVADLRSYCKHLAEGGAPAAAPAAPDLSNVVTPKAINIPKTAGAVTSGSVVTAAVTAHTAGFHWMAVGGIMAGIAAAGIGYEIWQDRAAKAANNLVHV